MPNRNKNKGDRAERKVRDWAVSRYPGSFRTRAGFSDDVGDVVVVRPGGRVTLQVKDVATPLWKNWLAGLAAQVATCTKESAPIPVLGGLIVHKARGESNPGKWRAIATLDDVATLIDNAYAAGYSAGLNDFR